MGVGYRESSAEHNVADLIKQENDANSLSLLHGMRRDGLYVET